MKINELKKLYIAVNEMVAKLGFEGEINTRDSLVDNVMEALHNIDGGEYLHGAKLDDKFNEVISRSYNNGYSAAEDKRNQPELFT